MNPLDLPRYDPAATYLENFESAPDSLPAVEIPAIPGTWTFCGRPVNSPLGIAAGPLLNGRWIRYYSALGFDVLTYKTVRSRPRDCYPLPNLVPVDAGQMEGDGSPVPRSGDGTGSWAVSFGMPSMEPEFWRRDIAETKPTLKPGQLLSVSVVGTVQPGWSIEDLAADYAQCARWAAAAGADAVEMNFSCPNVCSQDGQLYQLPDEARIVARNVRAELGMDLPLLVKVGYLPDDGLAERLLTQLAEYVDAVVTTNSVTAQVRDESGQFLFDSQPRGICGKATFTASVRQVGRFRAIIDRLRLPLTVIGVGGIESAEDVGQYLDAGAESVQLATALMHDPLIGTKIRQRLIPTAE